MKNVIVTSIITTTEWTEKIWNPSKSNDIGEHKFFLNTKLIKIKLDCILDFDIFQEAAELLWGTVTA